MLEINWKIFWNYSGFSLQSYPIYGSIIRESNLIKGNTMDTKLHWFSLIALLFDRERWDLLECIEVNTTFTIWRDEAYRIRVFANICHSIGIL